MEKCGHSLSDFVNERANKFSLKSACSASIGLLNCFEKLHDIGKVYNNLCLENVLIKKGNSRELAPRVMLINFERCTDFLTLESLHIEPGNLD